MSTKRTILYQIDEETGGGYHLYQDLMEVDDDGNGPVHLELNGVCFAARAGYMDNGVIDVEIPQEWAKALGLLPAQQS